MTRLADQPDVSKVSPACLQEAGGGRISASETGGGPKLPPVGALADAYEKLGSLREELDGALEDRQQLEELSGPVLCPLLGADLV